MLESGCLEESNLGRYGAPSVIKTNARLERGRLFKENQILGGQCARERESIVYKNQTSGGQYALSSITSKGKVGS